MPRTNLKLYSTDALGNTNTTTINYANPEADNADCLEFTQMLNQFTINTYGKTEKIVTTELDNEPEKQTPTLAIQYSGNPITTFQLSSFDTQSRLKISPAFIVAYNGDGEFFIPDTNRNPANFYTSYENSTTEGKRLIFITYTDGATLTTPFTINIGFTETDNYKAVTTTLTITT